MRLMRSRTLNLLFNDGLFWVQSIDLMKSTVRRLAIPSNSELNFADGIGLVSRYEHKIFIIRNFDEMQDAFMMNRAQMTLQMTQVIFKQCDDR